MLGATILLLGYLLAQIAGVRLRRLWRTRFDVLVRELHGDPWFTLENWRRVEFYNRASGGGWATLQRLARTPARMLRVEAPPLDPRDDHPYHPHHVKLRELHDLTAKLEWAAYPAAFGLTVTVCGLFLLAGLVGSLSRGGQRCPSAAEVRRAASGELLVAARAALDRKLKPAELYAISRKHAIRSSPGHP